MLHIIDVKNTIFTREKRIFNFSQRWRTIPAKSLKLYVEYI